MGGSVSCGSKNNDLFWLGMQSTILPYCSTVTYEGTFYSHYFAVKPTTTEVVAVEVDTARSIDPISGEEQFFLSLGFSSKYDGDGLASLGGRPPIQLIFVLDISGSMSACFPSHSPVEKASDRLTKLEAAKNALLGLLDNLKEGDSFGLVLFDTQSVVSIPLHRWGTVPRSEINDRVKAIEPRGGTDLGVGFDAALAEFERFNSASTDQDQVGRRVFFLTDMQVNAGDLVLTERFSTAATAKVPCFSTVIGFGIDFNSQLVESLVQIPGLNYFSVSSPDEFLRQMTCEFDYLLFTVASDLRVEIDPKEANPAKVVALCGSPCSMDALPPGTLLKVQNIFPSQTQGKERESTKGGIVIAQLAGMDPAVPLNIHISFTSFDGKHHSFIKTLSFPAHVDDYKNLSIRKAILLSRWVAFTKSLLSDVAQADREVPSISAKTGIQLMNESWLIAPTFRPQPDHQKQIIDQYLPFWQKFSAHYLEEEAIVADDLSKWRDLTETIFKRSSSSELEMDSV